VNALHRLFKKALFIEEYQRDRDERHGSVLQICCSSNKCALQRHRYVAVAHGVQ
jgi:hypothetical protein